MKNLKSLDNIDLETFMTDFYEDPNEVTNPSKSFVPLIICKNKGKILVYAIFCKIQHKSKIIRDWLQKEMIVNKEIDILSLNVFEDQCENKPHFEFINMDKMRCLISVGATVNQKCFVLLMNSSEKGIQTYLKKKVRTKNCVN